MPLTRSGNGFAAAARLHHPAEFTRCFRQGRRTADPYFTVLAATTGAPARLGLVVAKKLVADAVTRNRIKRTVRESFRLVRAALPVADIVVQARAAAAAAPNPVLRQSLERHWQELIKRCAES